MKEIARGAEAVIYLEKNTNNITKLRIPKSYRIKEIDDTLRKVRARSEVKILQKLSIPHPKLINYDEKNMKIEMEYIEGEKFRDVFSVNMCSKVGEYIATMHNENIIHGDLTTSNMIQKGKEIYFIDFGLSYFSSKIEDRAVDLHLLKEALESKHYKLSESAFKEVLKGYKKASKNYDEIISRFLLVEERGRHKNK